MPSRDETMVDMPTITPDRDEIVSRNTQGTGSGRRKPGGKQKPPSSGTAKGVTVLFVVSLLIGLSALVWAFTLQQKIQRADMALKASAQRIQKLEDQISSTDESVDKSKAALQVQLNEVAKQNKKAWTQIDQLWASAWRKNQAQIKSNQSEIKATTKSLSADIAALGKRLSEQKAATNKVESKINDHSAAVEKLNGRLSAIDSKGTYRQNQLEDLAIRVEQVAADIQMQNSRLTDNEDWIKAINTHRQQINKSLDALQKNIRELQAQEKGQKAAPTFQ